MKPPYMLVQDRNLTPYGKLSPRQREIAQMTANGYTRKQIAYILGLQQRTVDYHLRCAMERFRANTLPYLIYKMVRYGELPIGSQLSLEQIKELRSVPFAYTSPEKVAGILAQFSEENKN